MYIWTDGRGRQWPLHMTWETFREIRGVCPDLAAILDRIDAGTADPLGDFPKLAEVLLFVLRKTAPDLSDEDFSQRTEGRFVELAGEFAKELLHFFQRQGLGPAGPVEATPTTTEPAVTEAATQSPPSTNPSTS